MVAGIDGLPDYQVHAECWFVSAELAQLGHFKENTNPNGDDLRQSLFFYFMDVFAECNTPYTFLSVDS